MELLAATPPILGPQTDQTSSQEATIDTIGSLRTFESQRELEQLSLQILMYFKGPESTRGMDVTV